MVWLAACGGSSAVEPPDAGQLPSAVCGNGRLEAGEACDDGNLIDGDGCDSNCTPTGCGNHVVTAGEQCDDGNRVDGDGCEANCTVPVCGNHILDRGEACDDGNRVDGDGCEANCTVPACGNHILDPGEACDDGNRVDGDGCEGNCTLPVCGNHILDPGEECDDGNHVDADGCEADCTRPACGNHILDPGEQCDDGNRVDGDGCEADCTLPACGNHVVDPGEQCDDGNRIDADGCEGNCTLPVCGNHIIDPGEQCDDGNHVDADGCEGNCTLPVCGNHIIDPGEQCDDGNRVDADGCEGNCTLPVCGNHIVDPGEQCDDGNHIDADGCEGNCTLPVCGNHIVDPGEQCDDGNHIDADGCEGNCTLPVCGNHIVDPGEQCDDGNRLDGDGCDSNCTPTACGNGIVTSGEACDDGNRVDGDGCDSNCTPTGCGNGIVTHGEACDDGNRADGDGCDSNCTPTGCGNGIVTSGEACDDGNSVDSDGCTTKCVITHCGNGIVEPGEICYGPAAGQHSGGGAYDVATGDFDSDGRADVVVSNNLEDSLVILRGQGNGYLSFPRTLASPKPIKVVADDLNGDGIPDLVVTGGTGTLDVLLGNGDATFRRVTRKTIGQFGLGLTTGDFDADGHRDVAVAEQGSSTVSVFYGDGTGALSQPVVIQLWNPAFPLVIPWQIVAGDFDRDGDDDLAVTIDMVEFADSIADHGAVLPSRGASRSFGAPISFTTGADPKGITATDLNGDGILDLAVSNTNGGSSANKVAVMLGVGDGSFHPPTWYSTSSEFQVLTFGLTSADVDGDGHRDIIVSNELADTVSVLRGDGAGGVAEVVEVGAPNEPTAVAIADFNGDGRPDVAVTGFSSGNVAVLLHTDNGLLAGAPHQTVFGVANSAALADLDRDGHADLIIARQFAGVFVMRGLGDGSFAAPQQVSSDFVPDNLIVDDFNADGLPDISYKDSLTVVTLLQRGDGGFTRAATSYPADNDRQVCGDVDGDGILDIIGTQSSIVEIRVRTLHGNGDGTFGPPVITTIPQSNQNTSLAVADFNGDGALDVALGNFPDTGAVFGMGNGTFGPFVELGSNGFSTRSVVAIDFDRDGIPDLAVPGSPIVAFRGATASPFAEQHMIPVAREALQLAACDVDGDGTSDLATRFSDGVLVYSGSAPWQFRNPFFLASGTKSTTPGFWVADVNGDGVPDLMVRRNSDFVWFLSNP